MSNEENKSSSSQTIAADPVSPSPPREQEAREPLFDDLENFLYDDDDYNFATCSPLPYVTGTSYGEQQTENVAAAPVLTNPPSGSLDVLVPQNSSTMAPPLGHGSYSMHENVAPQFHATSIAPPVHATLLVYENSSIWSSSQNGLGSSNVPPSITPSVHSNDQQWGPSESQLGWPNPQNGLQQGDVLTNVPFGYSPDLLIYSYEDMQHNLAEIGFGTVPSWHRNSLNYPRVLLPSTNSPSSSSAPADLPPGNHGG